jgi:hypothetical protein
MRARSILRAGFMLAVAFSVAGAPARLLDNATSGRVASVRVEDAHPAAALVGAANGTPDADLRPGDERDPTAPLPGSAAGTLLLAGAVALAFLIVSSGRRPAAMRGFGPHEARAPPVSVTV